MGLGGKELPRKGTASPQALSNVRGEDGGELTDNLGSFWDSGFTEGVGKQ